MASVTIASSAVSNVHDFQDVEEAEEDKRWHIVFSREDEWHYSHKCLWVQDAEPTYDVESVFVFILCVGMASGQALIWHVNILHFSFEMFSHIHLYCKPKPTVLEPPRLLCL